MWVVVGLLNQAELLTLTLVETTLHTAHGEKEGASNKLKQEGQDPTEQEEEEGVWEGIAGERDKANVKGVVLTYIRTYLYLCATR